MISNALLDRLACPVCLEATGCARCARASVTHETCLAEYAERVGRGCGGPDKVRLELQDGALACPCCGVCYTQLTEQGYVDLLPRSQVGAVTQYADHEFHERLGVTDAPPVLSAGVKAAMMQSMLAPRAGQSLLDLGCGAGKLGLHTHAAGAVVTGVDVAPFFLARARDELDLVLGDLRRLPFRKGAFSNASSLDVLEHLEEQGVRELLTEARRVLSADGRLFVYTHAMESSALARFQRWTNRLARRLGRAGWLDHEREALRKSDHRNAIRSHEHFDALCAEAGLEVVERRYYNVVFKPVIEDLLLRLFQHRRRAGGSGSQEGAGHESIEPGAAAPCLEGPRPGRLSLALAHGLTWVLKLDVVLFGGIRTGPFFGLLKPRSRVGGT